MKLHYQYSYKGILYSIPMSKAFKSFYHSDDWKIEAEAHYYMYRPTSLGIQLVLA